MEDTPRPSTTTPQAMLLLGPTGAGKTPLGEILEERGLWGSRCRHFDFGATLRALVRRNRPDALIRRKDIDFLREVLDSGALLEDDQFPLAARILRSFMAGGGADRTARIVLNGLPRHIGQARAVDPILDLDVVVHLACSAETVFERIASNIAGDRADRVDDDPEAVRRKLAIYAQRVVPLLEYFRCRGARIETVELAARTTPRQIWDVLDRR